MKKLYRFEVKTPDGFRSDEFYVVAETPEHAVRLVTEKSKLTIQEMKLITAEEMWIGEFRSSYLIGV